MTHTLEEIEEILAITAEEAAQEYVDGEYGDPDNWTKTAIISAELKGDPGDRLNPDDAQVFARAVAEAFIRKTESTATSGKPLNRSHSPNRPISRGFAVHRTRIVGTSTTAAVARVASEN